MRKLLGCGCLLGLLFLVGLLVAGCALFTAIRHASAASGPAAVPLVPAQPEARSAAGPQGVFYRYVTSIGVPSAACRVVLAGDAAGRAPFWVDDNLRLIAHHVNGADRGWGYDFGRAGRVVPLPPQDLTAALGTDLQQLEVILADRMPPVYSSSALWLLPCANSGTVFPAATTAPAAGNTPNPRAERAGGTPTPPAGGRPDPPGPGPAPPGGPAGLWMAGLGLLGLGGLGLGCLLLRGVLAPRFDPLARTLRLELPGEPPLTTVISLHDLPRGIALAPLRLVEAGNAAAVARLVLAPGSGRIEVQIGRQPGSAPPAAAWRGTLSGEVIRVTSEVVGFGTAPATH